MRPLAYVVSPHGFGHAARSCAVMAELTSRCPAIKFEVFTTVPRWFFSDSLNDDFGYHELDCDVGLVQTSPLVEDLGATIDRLDRAWRDGSEAARFGERLRQLECSIAVVDISPLGLAAADAASIPSVLIENFTWDWIYANYPSAPARLLDHGRALAEVFESAGLRIQADPACERVPNGIRVAPIARRSQRARAEVRSVLGVPRDDPMVVVSMGGVGWDYGGFSSFDHAAGAWIVVPGGSDRRVERRGRMILLPFHADVYHPDLVAASDLVVSKLGYSTVAEAYRAGAALAYIDRPLFPESRVLARWVEEHLVAVEIDEGALRSGAWLEAVDDLLKVPRTKPPGPNGTARAAEVILEQFGSLID